MTLRSKENLAVSPRILKTYQQTTRVLASSPIFPPLPCSNKSPALATAGHDDRSLGTGGGSLPSRPAGRLGGSTLGALATLGLDISRGFLPRAALLHNLFAHRRRVLGRKGLRTR